MTRLEPSKAQWGLLDGGLLCAVAFGAAVGIPRYVWSGGATDAVSYFLQTAAIGGCFFVPTVLWLRFARRVELLRTWIPVDTALRDVVVGVEMALICGVMNGIGIKLLVEHPAPLRLGGVLNIAYRVDSLSDFAALLGGVGLIAPICEEVFFRGMLYTAMRRRIPAFPAVIFNAAIFAALHEPGRMRTAFLLGLLAAIMMEYTRSLVVPVLIHMGTNGAFVILLAGRGSIASAVPMSMLVLIFVVMNVHLFLAGRLLFGGKRDGGEQIPPGAVATPPEGDGPDELG